MWARLRRAHLFLSLPQIVQSAVEKQILLSTAYLPPISWFAAALTGKTILIEAHETYFKQSYRNRCIISGPNGVQALTAPISKPNGNRSLVSEVTLSFDQNWKKNHWRTIETAYNTSPFFLYYRDRIEKVLLNNHKTLFALNHELLELALSILTLSVHITSTNQYIKDASDYIDLRNIIHPKIIHLSVQNFPEYPQVFNDRHPFAPDLSIIDLIFNEGPASISYLRKIAEIRYAT